MVSPERRESMQKGWVRMLEKYGVAPCDAYPAFDVLVAAYSAPERHYHNLEHLGEMFKVVERLAGLVEQPDALHLAIWFHDAVYDSRTKDNERRSGELAVDLLGPLGVPAATIERIVSMIWATAHPGRRAARPAGHAGVARRGPRDSGRVGRAVRAVRGGHSQGVRVGAGGGLSCRPRRGAVKIPRGPANLPHANHVRRRGRAARVRTCARNWRVCRRVEDCSHHAPP